MTVLIPSATITKLSKVCSMFSSPYEAERATAAALADQIVKAAGLSWDDVIGGSARVRSHKVKWADTQHGMVSDALGCPDALTSWELRFVKDICGRKHLSTKQLNCLHRISLKVAAHNAARRKAA
jgi:hypothetical protein